MKNNYAQLGQGFAHPENDSDDISATFLGEDRDENILTAIQILNQNCGEEPSGEQLAEKAGIVARQRECLFSSLARFHAAGVLYGQLSLAMRLKTHPHLAVALVPSFLAALDQAETGTEDCHVFRFCVLTRQLHPM